jgi:hypothetical protein
MTKKNGTGDSLIFLAGAWFALANSILGLMLWSAAGKSVSFFLLLVVLPGVLSFFAGEGLGSDILKPQMVGTSKQALLQGAKVAVMTYLLLTPVAALGIAVYFCLYERDPHEWLTIQFFQLVFSSLIYVLSYGLFVFGWMLALVSAAAGWLLFKFRLARETP